MKSDNLNLGQLITTEQHRDAIHIAVAPVVAGERLLPGQRVGFIEGGRVGQSAKRHVGIVDPFLQGFVVPDEEFWLFLFPYTITSLRHEWSHPEFDGREAVNEKEASEKEASEKWLRDAAVQLGVSYEMLVSDYSALTTGDYINNGEHIRDTWYELLADGFWKHRKIVTGKDVPEDVRGGFSCSC